MLHPRCCVFSFLLFFSYLHAEYVTMEFVLVEARLSVVIGFTFVCIAIICVLSGAEISARSFASSMCSGHHQNRLVCVPCRAFWKWSNFVNGLAMSCAAPFHVCQQIECKF